MVVYADILIVLNLIVDYFLLALTAKLIHADPPVWRLLLGAAVGAVSSLYIFLPQSPVPVEAVVRLLLCAAMTFTVFGFRSPKRFFRAAAALFAVTFGYAGAMLALWYVLRPDSMLINNSVVYFDISPLFLIVFSVAGYIVSLIVRSCVARHSEHAEKCEIEVFADGKSIGMTAIVDTGNSMEDVLGDSEIIIADEACVRALFGDFRGGAVPRTRYRVLPCGTVSGAGLLEGYRCDKAYIRQGKTVTEIRRPVLAVSKSPLGGDYAAIINPRVLE